MEVLNKTVCSIAHNLKELIISMSSVLELEKLHNLLSVFSRANESLEKIVACERIREIIKKTDQVNKISIN